MILKRQEMPLPERCAFCNGHEAVLSLFAPNGRWRNICAVCVRVMHKLLRDEEGEDCAETPPTPEQIVEALSRRVVGQEQAKRVLAVAGHRHLRRARRRAGGAMLPKANILLIGPSGVGKTLLVRTLADALGVPLAEIDAKSLTAAGFAGEDPTSIGDRLFQAAGRNPEKARRGIVCIDNIDKLTGKPSAGGQDIGGISVQEALLSMLDHNPQFHRNGQGRRGEPEQVVDFSNVLFLCCGTFEGIGEIIDRRLDRGHRYGFVGRDPGRNMEGRNDQPWFPVEPQDLVAYGMIPEFVGRFPVIVHLDRLGEAELIDILDRPESALLKQYEILLGMSGVQLDVTDELKRDIAREAMRRGTGARGLRAVLESLLLDTMFDLPDRPGMRPDMRKVRLGRNAFPSPTPTVQGASKCSRVSWGAMC